MKTKLKTILALVLIALLPTLLMAMGASEDDSKNSPAADEKVTLRLVHWVSEDTKRAGFEEFEAEFIKKHPNVTFDNQSIPFAQYGSMLKLKISADDMPDIIFGKPIIDFPELARDNRFLDLTGIPELSKINPSVLSGATVDGKVYGIPFDATFMGLFYNKAMLAKYSLPVPTTYTELVQACDIFMKNGIYPFAHAFQNGNQPNVEVLNTGYASVLLASNNMDFYDKIMEGKTTFAATPVFKTYITRMAKLYSYSKGDEMGSDNTRARRQFSSGERPFMIQGTWAVGEYRNSNPTGDFGFTALPWSENPADNKVPVLADDCFMGAASTKYPELVKEFLASLATEQAANIWFRNTSLVSSLNDVQLENLDPMFVDAQNLAAEGKTMTPPATLAGEFGVRARSRVQLLVSNPSVNIDEWIANLDADMKMAMSN
jgi:ABC-type glycerol-3-phosphate transport system substrate-binding protein